MEKNKKNHQNQDNNNKHQLNKQNHQTENKKPIQEKDFLKQIEDLKKQIESLNNKNKELESEIVKMQNSYVTKIKEKNDEMVKIINDKKIELDEINKQKLHEFKTKLFTKDIVDLLNTINQFEKIISVEYTDNVIKNFLYGFKMFLTMFENSLSNMGINKFVPVIGQEFDHTTMEIVETQENTNQKSHTVSEIVSNGYKYNETVIMYAKVKVQK